MQNQAANPVITLDDQKLAEAWLQFIGQLSNDKSKNASVSSFAMARLEVVDENLFSIVSGTTLQQRFIESERGALIDHLQRFFNNKSLKFQQVLEESDQPAPAPEKQLNTREQFQLLAAQYPMVKELKDRLRLELDY